MLGRQIHRERKGSYKRDEGKRALIMIKAASENHIKIRKETIRESACKTNIDIEICIDKEVTGI